MPSSPSISTDRRARMGIACACRQISTCSCRVQISLLKKKNCPSKIPSCQQENTCDKSKTKTCEKQFRNKNKKTAVSTVLHTCVRSFFQHMQLQYWYWSSMGYGGTRYWHNTMGDKECIVNRSWKGYIWARTVWGVGFLRLCVFRVTWPQDGYSQIPHIYVNQRWPTSKQACPYPPSFVLELQYRPVFLFYPRFWVCCILHMPAYLSRVLRTIYAYTILLPYRLRELKKRQQLSSWNHCTVAAANRVLHRGSQFRLSKINTDRPFHRSNRRPEYLGRQTFEMGCGKG